MRTDKPRASYSDLLNPPNTNFKAKRELPPEPIVKPEGAAPPREKKRLFGPRKASGKGSRRQGMPPPPPGEPTPPVPPSKPKLAPPEDWKNEDRYPIGHTKSAVARILGINRKTVGRWAIKGTLDELPMGHISVESIKRLKESNREPTND